MRTLTADRLTIPRGELLLTAEISHKAILTADPEPVKLAVTPGALSANLLPRTTGRRFVDGVLIPTREQ
jgi:hypothetical protein